MAFNFARCRWASGTCELHRTCPFAHGEEELEAWNEHLEKMEEERKLKTEEGKEERTTGGRSERSSNKVNYHDMQTRCNYDSIFVSLWPVGHYLLPPPFLYL